MRRACVAAFTLVAFCVGAVPAVSAQTPRVLTFDALRNIVAVHDPQVSPDGKSVAYIRSRSDFKHDRTDSEVMIVAVAGGTPRVLTRGKFHVASPRWSPDGTRLAYIASASAKGKPQIFVLPMNGGDSQEITHAKQGVSGFAWRPDGNGFAYVTEDPRVNEKQLKRHLDAVVITDNDYLTEEAPSPEHLWSIDAGGKHVRRLNSGSWSIVGGSEPVWSSDGSRVYYQRQPDAIFAHFVEQTTYVHDMQTGRDSQVFPFVDSEPKLSSDGKFAAISVPRHGSLYLQDDVSVRFLRGGSEAFNTRAVDRNAHWYDFMPGAGSIAFAAADGVRNALWIVPQSGPPSKIDLGDVGFAPDASIGKDGGIVFVGLRPDRYGEIYYLAPGAKTPTQLTNENAWLADYAVAKSAEIRWTIDNGMTADGVLTYPVGYVHGRKYPLVLDIHGGPVSTSTLELSGLEGGELAQLLAARGYLVFRPNYRGSDNNGDAFLQAIVGDVTSGPGRDNRAAVDALRKMGIVDESRIFVSGWSGGGLQTSWLIGHAHFWRAAVSGAAVNDWYQQALLADINENFAQTFFGGVLPFSPQGRAKYRAESPIAYVDGVRTPTLILSDTRDQRVPVSQAYTLYHALRDRGVPVQFTAFPRYGHFPADPVGREQALKAWIGWIERWSK
jgi:dipeptidyl aminopeptidase/acylaminoacyl peptidase